MINFDDFKNSDGKIDWKAYDQAKIDNGDLCQSCKQHILFGGKGFATDCISCKNLKLGLDTSHDTFIRCPSCGNLQDVSDGDNYELYDEGEHEVDCYKCHGRFLVNTDISYSFTSSVLEKDK